MHDNDEPTTPHFDDYDDLLEDDTLVSEDASDFYLSISDDDSVDYDRDDEDEF